MKARFITTVVTAFDNNYNLDIKANHAVWDFVIEGGTDGILLMGSTGEFFAMTMEQRKILILSAREHIGDKVPLLIGTGCMTQEDTIELSRFAVKNGADGIIIVPPYYFALTQDSLEDYFDDIASAVDTKIYLYNYPERTSHDMNYEMMFRLLKKHDNIVGCKDTVLDFTHTRMLINRILPEYPDFEIYSGYDDHFAHNVLSGGSGAIGGLTNVAPEIGSGWVNAFNENDIEKISFYQKQMDILGQLTEFGGPYVPIVKRAMKLRGLAINDVCTHPLQKPTSEQNKKIQQILKKADIL